MAKKNILLLYYYYHHHQMVERVASSMLDYGIGVDVLCMDNMLLVRNSEIRLGFANNILLYGFMVFKKGLFYRVARWLFTPSLLKLMMRKYDLVDFHAYNLEYIPLMKYCVENGFSFDITPWGSDIMRASEEALNKKRYGFDHCRYIKATENLQEVINEKYSSLFAAKFKTVYFGNNDFETIDWVTEGYKNDVNNIREEFIHEAKDKIIVTCGYNGSKSQNHIKIFEAIGRLSKSTLDKIYLLIPLTYGASYDYLLEVERAVKKLGISYTLYTNRLPVDDIAKIRLVSDVVINMQDTDAFSGSLQDHLYCKNVLIVGEWLNYVPLDNVGVYYIKTSYDQLTEDISKVLTDLASYKQKSEDNYIKMKHLTSWEYVLPRWGESYQS